MRDVVFVSVTLGFFGLATAYVRACARIVGPEEISTTSRSDSTPLDEASAPAAL